MRKTLKKLYKKILLGELRHFSCEDDKVSSYLLEELYNDFKAISLLNTTNLCGAELLWSQNLNQLKKCVLNENPKEFLQWKVIKDTMYIDVSMIVFKEFFSLKRSSDFNNVWKEKLRESSVGRPNIYKMLAFSSGNLIHHSYHLQQLKRINSIDFEGLTNVVEFGGGYGSMCRLLYKFNKNLNYVIFDLPHFTALQKYYLKSLGIKIITLAEMIDGRKGVLLLSNLNDLSNVFKKISKSNNLFISTWAISETPIRIREQIFQNIYVFDNLLLAYQNTFGGIDNLDYFSNLTKSNAQISWKKWEISHIKNNYYLIGKRE